MPKPSIRFIHCADLHLDSPMRGLANYAGAPVEEMRTATRRSFSNVVDLALEREVDLMLISGDVFDKDWPDFNTGLFFANQLRRLVDAAVRVFVVSGNHDAVNKISRTVPLPKNVKWFEATEATTFVDETLGVAIHGQSFATDKMSDDLASRYPDAYAGLLNIGLLHTSLTGREGLEHYAPTSADRLTAKGYQYWALGHIHKRSIIREEPWIVFPGNIQGRHARELGPKGCVVVAGDAERGILSPPEFVATDVARWVHLTIDANNLTHLDDLATAVQREVQQSVLTAGNRPLAVRLSVNGRSLLHGALSKNPEQFRTNVCAWLNEASSGNAWLEKINSSLAAPMDLEVLAKRDDPFGILLRRLNALGTNREAVDQIAASVLSELEQKIPVELRGELLGRELGTEALRLARERLLASLSMETPP